jgi:small-conductance mechanosensitive channel
MGRHPPCIGRALSALCGAVALLLAAGAGVASGQAPAAPQASDAPAPAAPFPLTEVAARSTEATNRLAAIATQLAPREETEKIRLAFFQASRDIDREFADTLEILARQPTLAGLQTLQTQWKSRQEQLGAWLGALTRRAGALQEGMGQLAVLQAQWAATRDAAEASAPPPATRAQIDAVLTALGAAQRPLMERHNGLLGLQVQISEALNRCEEALARLEQARRGAVAGILTREHRPIWSPATWEQARASLPGEVDNLSHAFREDAVRYLRDPAHGMPLHLGLAILLAWAFSSLRRLHRHWAADAQQATPLTAVFERPWAAALCTAMFLATSYQAPTTPLVKDIFSALALAPILRLVQPAIAQGAMPAVYAVAAVYALDILRAVFGVTAALEQLLLLLVGLGGIAALRWLEASGRWQAALGPLTRRVRAKSLDTIGRVIMVGLVGGLLAGALGNLSLARLIMPGIVSACWLGLSLYACLRVLNGVLAGVLRMRPLRELQMVRRHRGLLEKRICRLILWAALLGWAVRSLDRIGLLAPLLALVQTVLATTLERGSISISLGDVLAFGITIWASYLVSNFIRFALQEEVYPRAHIPSGTAYAASRLVHYTVLALGFVMGLGLLGMDLTRVSVLAGALGVGIGFGLQSVVNNVVCGLILLFERPIHVGDTVEVAGLFGEVRRIGFRACTVRTPQGAEIIIPNADFITANVTNWTFSDRLRRIDIPVGVNYASAPIRVIALLEEVAGANPEVLKVPEPRGLFMGYGDSSINFELRAWIDQSSDHMKIRSDLNAAVYDAVQAAGMSFPFPQREVRLLGDA